MPRLAKMPPIQEDIHACTMCGYCVAVCPAYQEAGWEGASPRGRVFALRQYEMRGPLDLLLRRKVKPGEAFAKSAWECTGCGACEEICPVDIPFDELWDDVEEGMGEAGGGAVGGDRRGDPQSRRRAAGEAGGVAPAGGRPVRPSGGRVLGGLRGQLQEAGNRPRDGEDPERHPGAVQDPRPPAGGIRPSAPP